MSSFTGGFIAGTFVKNALTRDLNLDKNGFRDWRRGKRYDYYRNHRIPHIRRPAMDYYDNHWIPPYEIITGPTYPVYYFVNDSYMGGLPQTYYQQGGMPGKFIAPY